MTMDSSSRSPNDGYALVVVLCVLVLLTTLVTVASNMSMGQRRLAKYYAESVQSTATADSAIRISMLKLMQPAGQVSQEVSSSVTLEVLGDTVLANIEHESGRIDLNTAPQSLIFSVFMAADWPEHEATQLAARIVDWRDKDETALLGGAEEAEYRNAGVGHAPRNGPFERVEELRQVLGGNRMEDGVLDAFTVYTHMSMPNQQSMNSLVEAALHYAENKQLDGRRWLQDGGEVDAPGFQDRFEIGEIIRINACIPKGSPQYCRRAVVRLTGNASDPIQVFLWQ